MDKARIRSGSRGPRRRRVGVGAGLLMAFLLMLAPAGNFPTNLPVARSQENTASYETEFQNGLRLLRNKRYDEALKSFKRANDMRNKQSAECYFGMAQAYQGLLAYKNVVESCDKMLEFSAGDTKTQANAYNLKGIALQSQADGKDQKKLQNAEPRYAQ